MSDLIFVPEIGIISGKSQSIKVKMRYPQPFNAKHKIKKTQKLRKNDFYSPFVQTQRLIPLRNKTRSPKKAEKDSFPFVLDVSLSQRPTSTSKYNARVLEPRFSQEKKIKPEEKPFSNGLEIGLQQRPTTMAGNKRQRFNNGNTANQITDDLDPVLNLPSLQRRPSRT